MHYLREQNRKNGVVREVKVQIMKLQRSLLLLAPLAATTAFLAFRTLPRVEAATSTVQSPAPELVGQQWLNTSDNKPIKLSSRQGKVTIVEFWTFGCSNCRANLPAYANWARDFKKAGVEVIGVHTPELPNERDPENVAEMVKKLGITYPVLLDNSSTNWQRYKTRYWPTIYVLDRHNFIRAKWEGELEYGGAGGTAQITKIIENLLATD
jgi:thiol-disulfide isomerase/thioredoxin